VVIGLDGLISRRLYKPQPLSIQNTYISRHQVTPYDAVVKSPLMQVKTR
jgi:hypothetical protein